MNETGPASEGDDFVGEVTRRLGVLPNFFSSAPAVPGLLEPLWAFAKAAYLDSPLPSLFKERLFVHLGRFCEVRYCVVRHVGFLLGQGRPAGDRAAQVATLAQALALLKRPVPDDRAIDEVYERLLASERGLGMPEPETQREADLFDALTVLFLTPARAARARAAVRHAVGEGDFERLMAFLAFVRTCQYWTETHPELEYEPDVDQLLSHNPELARLVVEAHDADAVSLMRRRATWLGAQNQAQQSEARFRTLAETAPALIWQNDARGENQFVNRYFLDYTGLPAEAVAGNKWRELVHPEDAEAYVADYMAAVTEQRAFRNRNRIRRHDGQFRWFENCAQPLFDEQGHYVGHVGVSTDVTAAAHAERVLRESEERQAFLLLLSDALRPLEDEAQITVAAATVLGRHVRASRVAYAENIDDEHFRVSPNYVNGVPNVVGVLRYADFGADIMDELRAGQMRIQPDVERDGRLGDAEKRSLAAVAVRASLNVPIVKKGRLVAFLGINYAAPHDFSPAEMELSREVAERTWAAVERARAESARRESEERFRALFAASPIPFLVLDPNPPNFTIAAANDAYLSATRTTREGLIGRPLFDVFTDDPRRPGARGSEALASSLRRVLSSRRPDAMDRMRSDLVTPAGAFEPHWWLAINAPLLDASGQVTAIIHQITRVTELHLSEASERANQDRQAFLLTLSDALRTLTEPLEAQTTATKLLAERLGAMRAGYFELEPDGDTFRLSASYERDAAPMPERMRLSDFSPVLVDALRTGRTLAVSDTAVRGELVSDPAAYARIGVRAWAAVPLLSHGQLSAWIAVQSPTSREWTPADLQVLNDVAERAWTAVERTRAETALRESEERFRQFGEASSDVLWIVDAATRQLEYLSPAFERVWGVPREAVAVDLSRWAEFVHPDDRAVAASAMPRALAGTPTTIEYRIIRADGEVRYITDVGFPMFGADGRVVRVGGISQDWTNRRQAEAAVRASERQLQTLMQGVPQLVWRAVDAGHWTWASPQWVQFTGQPEEDGRGWGWLDPVHPEDRARVRQQWARAVGRGEFHADHRIYQAQEGRYRWFQTRASPVRDERGQIIEWLGTSTDIDDLRQLQERQQVLVAELQHRTFNLMAIIRSMADATIRSSASLDEFKPNFRDRIDALARVQRLLSRLKEDDRVTFDELIRGELEAVGALHEGDTRVELYGPEGVALRSSTVQILAMAIHELTTNALKYGALRQSGARLSVRWRVDRAESGRPWLYVDWLETGVAMPAGAGKAQGTGQGRTLIEKALPYQLRAKTTYVLTHDGVRCSIALPVSARTLSDSEPATA